MDITLSVDDEVVRKARRRADQLGTNVNQLVCEYLEQLAGKSDPLAMPVSSSSFPGNREELPKGGRSTGRKCTSGDEAHRSTRPCWATRGWQVQRARWGSLRRGDLRIMTLPGDAGHVAIAVFVKASEAPAAKRERAIAEIARAAHDYFLLQ